MIYGYVRVSSTGQEDNSSRTEQERKIRAVAMARGEVDPFAVQIFSEVVTGSQALSKRKQGAELLNQLQAGDILIAAKLDRIFRDATDALNVYKLLQDRNVGLVIADFGTDTIGESVVGKLIFTVLSACAEFERNRINERTNEGRKAKKARGGCVGNAPLGFRREGFRHQATLVPDPTEQQVLATVARACQGFARWSQANSARKDAKDQVGYVLRALQADNFKDRKGNAFDRGRVKRMIAALHSSAADKRAA